VFWTGHAEGGGRLRQAVCKWGLAVVVASGLSAGGIVAVQARTALPGETVALAQLPVQAQETYQRVLSGGPFPYRKDGTVFGNRERLLPLQDRGYYREYTVKTPGSRDRGARRIVCGGRKATAPEDCYYTADHYASFSRIVP
jgi:ribonuclease T1